jgi:hypothetical protein
MKLQRGQGAPLGCDRSGDAFHPKGGSVAKRALLQVAAPSTGAETK